MTQSDIAQFLKANRDKAWKSSVLAERLGINRSKVSYQASQLVRYGFCKVIKTSNRWHHREYEWQYR